MKRLILFALTLLSLGSCQKTKEKVAEDLVIQAMTSGQWKITSFVDNGTNITSSFSGYQFQFYSNRTVDAIKSGTVESTGNWEGNADARTIWSVFSGAASPVSLINGTWTITDNSWTYVIATKTVGSDTKTLRLDKL